MDSVDTDKLEAEKIVQVMADTEQFTLELMQKYNLRTIAFCGYHVPTGKFVSLAGQGDVVDEGKHPDWRRQAARTMTDMLLWRLGDKPEGTI